MSEKRKAAVFSCEYSEQNPVYCQQCGGHEHLCKKRQHENTTMSDETFRRLKSEVSNAWCIYANYLIQHGNDMRAIEMRTNALATTSEVLDVIRGETYELAT